MSEMSWNAPGEDFAEAVADAVARLLSPEPALDLDVLASVVATRLSETSVVSASEVASAALARTGPTGDTRRAPRTVSVSGLDTDRLTAQVIEQVSAVQESASPQADATELLAAMIAARLSEPVFVATPGELEEFADRVGRAVWSHLDEHADTLPREDVEVGRLLEDTDDTEND